MSVKSLITRQLQLPVRLNFNHVKNIPVALGSQRHEVKCFALVPRLSRHICNSIEKATSFSIQHIMPHEEEFSRRHIGPSECDANDMLRALRMEVSLYGTSLLTTSDSKI